MKYKNLKAYHAYYIVAALFFITMFFEGLQLFPIACAFLCLAYVSMLKETGRLQNAKQTTASSSDLNAEASSPAVLESDSKPTLLMHEDENC